MELSKRNFDLTIQKSTLVTSEMRGFGVNILLPPRGSFVIVIF